MSLARSSTASAALATALPPSCSDREPPVPPPRGTRAVSDWTNRIDSMGMPRRSATIMANDVGWPWPCPDVPTLMVAVPSSWISTAPYSLPPPPAVTSTYEATPMPRSCGRPAPGEPPARPAARRSPTTRTASRSASGVVAAVVGDAHERRVREHVVVEEVLEAQLDGIDAELVGGDVHDPLEHGRRLRAARRRGTRPSAWWWWRRWRPRNRSWGCGTRLGPSSATARAAGRRRSRRRRRRRRPSRTRMPTMAPSLVKPISTYCTWPRPWAMATRFSERLSVHIDRPPEVAGDADDRGVLGDEARPCRRSRRRRGA